MKKTVTLDSGLTLEIDMARAFCPEASLALYQNDREGNSLGMIHFLTLALGAAQRDRLIESLRAPDGTPGSWSAMSDTILEMFTKLGSDGKKS